MIFKNKKNLSIFNIPYLPKISIPFIVVILGVFLLPKTAYLSTITPEKIIELTNKERIKKDLEPLKENSLLLKAAERKAQDLMKAQKFEHNLNGKKFSQWIKDVDYNYHYAGENLAINFIRAEATMDAWIDSPSHKKNILNSKFKEIGVAVLEGEFQGQNTILTVQIFGTPFSKYATLTANSAKSPILKTQEKNSNFMLLGHLKKKLNLIEFINLLLFTLISYTFLKIFVIINKKDFSNKKIITVKS